MKHLLKVNIVEEFKPFGYTTSSTEISNSLTKDKDLSGRVFAITGATLYSLGYETAKSLLARNAEVIILSRSANKMNAAAEELEKTQPAGCTGRLYQVTCDLGKQKSVHDAVDQIKTILDERNLPLDSVICSAGRYFKEKSISEDGFELTMAIDHYGHFTLVISLLDRMKENGRVVMLASNMHTKVNRFPLEDLKFEKEKYSWLESHNRAKLANMMFSYQLNNVLEEAGSKIVSYAIYPGAAKTNFTLEESFVLKCILRAQYRFFGLSREVAAATTTFAALEPRLEGRRNLYLSQCGISDEINPILEDKDLLKNFFNHSLEVTKLKIPTFRK